jgi:hypothetical protein
VSSAICLTTLDHAIPPVIVQTEVDRLHILIEGEMNYTSPLVLTQEKSRGAISSCLADRRQLISSFSDLVLMDEFTQPKHGRLAKRIRDANPIASAIHNPGAIEDLQMPGNVWLVSIKRLHYLSYRHLSVP